MDPYHFARKQFLRDLQKGVDVKMRWRSVTDPAVHPTTGAILGEAVEVSETVKGIFHPMDAKTQIHHFNQVKRGVAYLDMDPATTIEGRDGLCFDIDGRTWVQNEAGESVIEHFDTVHQGARYCRTIIIRLA